jgi:hypothetical protein
MAINGRAFETFQTGPLALQQDFNSRGNCDLPTG